MLRSMTAFARSEQLSEDWTIIWELRSVNHRYLELAVRLPETLRALEGGIRERISNALSRGKVEANLKLQSAAGNVVAVSLNRPLAIGLLNVAAELEALMGPGTGLRLGELFRWPGVVSEMEPALEILQQAILTCLDSALAELVNTREREGERIGGMILQRCEAMRTQLQKIRIRRPEVLARQREKLLSRLAELPVEPDHHRLEQELVLIAQRLDVEEELDRLEAHLDEIVDVLRRPEAVGRRLDFLMQELNREANTLASKSADTETTRAAVELKVLIEQMREQVQNIE